jgi:glycerol 2-dehydrogenase (NADP+)
MEKLVTDGKVKTIGVSNFSQMKLEEILPTAEIIPAVNQLEIHLWNPQHNLVAYLRSKGIIPQAYSPLGYTHTATEFIILTCPFIALRIHPY